LTSPVGVNFFLVGLRYYGFAFATHHRFANMSALLLSGALIVSVTGRVSEQFTNLTYRR